MNQLRALVSAILDKADTLLTTEPARLIGYGAAGAIFLAVQAIEYVRPGLLPAVSFTDALGMAVSAVATLVILVESIRRFVFSPMTYIEDLADESQAAHEAAHLEEDLRSWLAAAKAEAEAASEPQPPQPERMTLPVGTVKPGKSN